MPPECQRDLSWVDTPVRFVPMERAPDGPRIMGLWLNGGESRTILIDETLTGWRRDETIHHERCHEVMFRLTGSAKWHP
jgi:hypothetical protein